MENLNLKETKSSIKSKDGLNYNRLASLVHLNDVKNVIKRIANHKGIMVSFINPKYTSKQCLVCGNIDKDNRPTQEEFLCTSCSHSPTNPDINAACNIKNRITLFKKQLNIKFDKDFNGFKESKYNSKVMYEGLYDDFDLGLIIDELWITLDV